MTDRVNSLTIVLERDMRVDDVEATIRAIKCLRGVLSVEAGIASPGDYIAEKRVKNEIMKQLFDVLSS